MHVCIIQEFGMLAIMSGIEALSIPQFLLDELPNGVFIEYSARIHYQSNESIIN